MSHFEFTARFVKRLGISTLWPVMDYRNFESDGLENTSKNHANHARLSRFKIRIRIEQYSFVNKKVISNFLFDKKKLLKRPV